MDKDMKYQNIIAQAWLGMAILLVAILVVDIFTGGLQKDFSSLGNLGIRGLWVESILLCVNLLVQCFVKTFKGQALKWTVLVVGILYTLNFITHQVFQLMSGDGLNIHFIFYLLHHVLGIWAIIYTFKWIKAGDTGVGDVS